MNRTTNLSKHIAKRRMARRSAAIALAGLTLMAPSMASADPSFTALLDGTPVTGQSTASSGQAITLTGAGCTNGGNPAYMGEYVSTTGDPWVSTVDEHYELEVDAAGGFEWEVVLPEPTETTEYFARWYCSPTPATGVDDPNLVWISPEFRMTLSPAMGPNAMMAASSGETLLRSQTSNGGRVTIAYDQDALPLVDRVGIPGDVAAGLKARVDARAANVGQVQRLYQAFFGRFADTDGLSFYEKKIAKGESADSVAKTIGTSTEARRIQAGLSDEAFVRTVLANVGAADDEAAVATWTQALAARSVTRWQVGQALASSPEAVAALANRTYVSAAFHSLLGATARAETIATFAAQLDRGDLKVAVIENIALSVRPTEFWVANA